MGNSVSNINGNNPKSLKRHFRSRKRISTISSKSQLDSFSSISNYTTSTNDYSILTVDSHNRGLNDSLVYNIDTPVNSQIKQITTSHQLLDSTRNYSSELVLKELYMSCETDPERQRDCDRRHRQHYLSKRIWKSNYKIPLKNPTLIVNWCCATAVWDLELAFEFPNAQIVGIDYASVTVASLTKAVKNFCFQDVKLHEGNTGLQRFEENQVDYVMMRDVWLVNTPSIKWKQVLKEVYRILKPGGFIEIYERDPELKSIGPYFTKLETWSDRFYKDIDFDRNTVYELETFLDETGYMNIQHESIELPVGEWSDTKEMKEIGYLQKDIIERIYREGKRWCCGSNGISEDEYIRVLEKAIDECEEYNTTNRSLYYSAQKPFFVNKSF